MAAGSPSDRQVAHARFDLWPRQRRYVTFRVQVLGGNMIDDILSELKSDIAKSHDNLRKTLARIRTGRANPDILDAVRVDYWGTPTPISQMANISVPEARMLLIKAWDRQNVKAIEKAIITADLGLNPQTDGELIRLPMPALTEERRRDLTKQARKVGEEAKVGIRKHRQDSRALLENLK